jgi:hypothetical protein
MVLVLFGQALRAGNLFQISRGLLLIASPADGRKPVRIIRIFILLA